MMRQFAIVNGVTGELEDNCPHCGLRTFGALTDEDLDLHPVGEGHVMVELEYMEFVSLRVKNAVVGRGGIEVELEPHEPFLPDDKAICVRKRELAIDLDAFEVQNSRVPMERRPFVDDVLEVDRVEGKELSVMGRKPRTIIFPKANINKTKGFLYEKKP